MAHPAEKPFATPTTFPENMELIQYWHATKLAREKPIRNRIMMKALGVEIKEMERTTGTVRRENAAEARRGPTRSHMGPMARREKMAPANEAIPAWPMST